MAGRGGPQPGSGPPEGNQNARRGTEWRDAIKEALAQRDETGSRDYRKSLAKVAGRLYDAALAGEMAAIKEIGERFDGKAHQTTSVDLQGQCNVSITPQDSSL